MATLTARGAAETIVPHLPVGGHHTRDVVFSPDGKTMYVSVGSGSNVAEDMGKLGGDELHNFVASHPLGATWGDEADRADVLAFDPDGKNERIFATGIRNCVGMAVAPATGTVWCSTNERDGLGRQRAARLHHARARKARFTAGPGTISAPTRTRGTRANGRTLRTRSPSRTCCSSRIRRRSA